MQTNALNRISDQEMAVFSERRSGKNGNYRLWLSTRFGENFFQLQLALIDPKGSAAMVRDL